MCTYILAYVHTYTHVIVYLTKTSKETLNNKYAREVAKKAAMCAIRPIALFFTLEIKGRLSLCMISETSQLPVNKAVKALISTTNPPLLLYLHTPASVVGLICPNK